MTYRRAGALWLASAGMELCWLAAWASFTLDAVSQHRYPVPRAGLLFAFTSLVTQLTVRLRLPSGYALGVQTVGLGVFLSRPDTPWQSYNWLGMGSFLGWTLAFWVGGLTHAARAPSYPQLCARWDRGLCWLFVLSFAELLLHANDSITLSETVSARVVFPFFAFALPALTLARAHSGQGAHKTFMTGQRGTGATLGFIGLSCAFVFGFALLLVPSEQLFQDVAPAQSSGQGPLLTALGYAILFLVALYMKIWERIPIYFGRKLDSQPQQRYLSPRAVEPMLRAPPTHESAPSWPWLLAVACLAGLLWYVWWRKTAVRADGTLERPLPHLLRWFRQLWRQLLARWTLQRERRRRAIALQLYAALSRWGSRSGLPRRPSETPREYGERLKAQIVTAAPEIDVIVAAVNEHLYGTARTPLERERVRAVLRALQSPRLWPKRYKTWLLSPGASTSVVGPET